MCSFWQHFLSIFFSFFQQLCLCLDGSFIIRVSEEFGREIEQVVSGGCCSEIHSVDVVSRSVHLALQHRSQAHLILQDGFSLLSLAYHVSALSGTAFQHQKSIFPRVLQQFFCSDFK